MRVPGGTALYLPFKGEWFVYWGGYTKKLNYHHDNLAQKYAFDFVIIDKEGRTHHKSLRKNNSYYCFDQAIVSPAKGTVVQVVDGVDDNPPGCLNEYWLAGNTVIIKHSKKIYSFLAHFKQNSIVVRTGDKVKAGDLLGYCGNSGRSSEPHLHFHLQNGPNVLLAKGVKCLFQALRVNAKNEEVSSPIKGDIVCSIQAKVGIVQESSEQSSEAQMQQR